MAKRGPYNRFLNDNTAEVPKVTLYRWNQNKRLKLQQSTEIHEILI
jgi:hypothetical protein